MVSDVIAGAALAVSIAGALVSWRLSGRAETRQTLAGLMEGEVSQARDVVGRAAALASDASPGPTLDEEGRGALRAALFTLMWTIRRGALVPSRLVVTRTGEREARLLYGHLGVVVRSMNEAFAQLEHGEADFTDSVEHTNAALASLPQVFSLRPGRKPDDERSRTYPRLVAYPPDRRLDVSPE